jgi:Protein of unknown function (DUF3106)
MTDLANNRQYSPAVALKMGYGWLLSVCLTCVGAQTPAPEAAASAAPSASTPLIQAAPPSQAWQQLTPRQKQALAPLGAQWGALTPQQQNKWLAISRNFAQLSVAEQITMHARMTDWVALSPQQRNLARLNFNTLQSVPKEDRKAKWEAYQALSAEEKRLLSAGSGTPPKSAAPTAKPLEPHRQVKTPVRPAHGTPPTVPTAIDRKTLLPRPAAQTTPATMAPIPTLPPTGTPDTNRPATETAPS